MYTRIQPTYLCVINILSYYTIRPHAGYTLTNCNWNLATTINDKMLSVILSIRRDIETEQDKEKDTYSKNSNGLNIKSKCMSGIIIEEILEWRSKNNGESNGWDVWIEGM